MGWNCREIYKKAGELIYSAIDLGENDYGEGLGILRRETFQQNFMSLAI